MFKKSLIRWLSLCLLIVTVVGVVAFGTTKAEAAPTGYVLEDMVVVLPAGASDVERTAASELVAYLKKMTGKATSVVNEGASVKKAIYVGATKFATENGVTAPDKHGVGEGWAIKGVGDHLVVTGSGDRGTLYGVYHLLEDELGVHWWNLWEEYVPDVDDAIIPFDIDRQGEPVFSERGIYSNESYNSLFYVRNRLNGWTSNAPVEFGDENNFARPYHVHIFNRYYPAFYDAPTSDSSARWVDTMNPDGVDWFIEHPEWFSWSDSRQSRISYGQLCMSNEELAADLADKVCKAIALSYEDADKAGKARPTYISVTPNDLGGLCECDMCEWSTERYGPSGHLLRLVNKIAAVVAEKYPEMTVETLAYWQYFEVPLDPVGDCTDPNGNYHPEEGRVLPADNVVIRLASSDVNVMRDIDHPTNTLVKARLQKWGELLQPYQLWYWDYAVNYSENGIFPNYFKFGNDYRQVAEAGGFGVFTECQNISAVDFWDLKHWLLTKAQEDPYYYNEFEQTQVFLNGYYGADAADDLYAYLVKMDELAESCQIAYDFSDEFIDAPWLSVENVKWANERFEEALAKTEANEDLTDEEKELFINRICAARTGLDRQILANYDRYLEEATKAAGGDADKLLGLTKKEVGLRMMKAQQWLGQMQVEDDHTGLNNTPQRSDGGFGNYSMYAGDTDSITGDYVDRPAIPEMIYEDHPGIDDAHIHDFTNSTFWNASAHFGHTWVGTAYDASYEGGTSVFLDQAEAVRQNGSLSSYYKFSETKTLNTSFKAPWFLGDPIQNDAEWHWYRAEDVMASSRICFYDESLRFEMTDMDQLYTRPVDIYVSMKVVGDPTGEDPNNYAIIYIDRLIIVEDCAAYDIEYTSTIPATCKSNAIQKGLCPVCGKVAEAEIAGTKLNHKLTEGYTYDAATNTYSTHCSVCGDVEFSNFYTELPQEVLTSIDEEGTEMSKIYDFAVRDFGNGGSGNVETVDDPDSPLGIAYRYDLNKISNLGHFKITDTASIYTWNDQFPKANMPYAKDIITDGQYHIYKIEDVNLFGSSGEASKIYLFDWSFQLDISKLSHLKGKLADVFLSFKVEGDLKYDVAGSMPVYYIDRFIIVENCPNHTAESFTFDAVANNYVGACVNCGKDVILDGSLPQDIVNGVADGTVNTLHITDLDATAIQHGAAPAALVDDADAFNGKALYVANEYKGTDLVFAFVSGGEFFRIPASEMQANVGKGYKTYKLDDIVVPTNAGGDLGYMYTPSWYIQFRNQWGFFNGRMGNTVDVYISMKIEGSAIYLDRFLMVGNCEDHLDAETAEVLSKATCYQGEIHRAECKICGAIVEAEQVDTRKPHKFGDYTYDADLDTYVAACQNAGCSETKTMDLSALPVEVQDRVSELGVTMDHVYIYGANSFTSGGGFKVVNDADAYQGQAFSCNSGVDMASNPNAIGICTDISLAFVNASSPWATIKLAEQKTYLGLGYHVYSFEDLVVPTSSTGSLGYMWAFKWYFSNRQINNVLDKLQGKTVDLYVSMKVNGNLSWSKPYPTYSFDQMILIDRCENHELTYEKPEDTTCSDTNVVLTATCEICGKEFTKDGGAAGGHSFTKYVAVERSNTKYVAECDYGCGTTDMKEVEVKPWQELLPTEMTDPSSPNYVHPDHIIQSYRIGEFNLSGVDDGKRLDLETGRAVGVREFDPELSASVQYALNTASSGILAAMYKAGMPSEGVGTFQGSEIKANANSGKYHLYKVASTVPIKYDSYNYMYMFSDWVLQIQMFDDDLILRGFKNKAVDLYLYMKVDGDPSCSGEDKPIYYIDQIIVTSSCEPDETWVTITEPTCNVKGLQTGHCAICGRDDATFATATIPHTIEEPMTYKEPTCKTNKWEYGKCTVCGQFEEQEVPDTTLEHIFENYIEQEDGVTEIAYCSRGCGERVIRTIGQSDSIEIPEKLEQMLPVIGNAAAGAAGAFNFSDVNVGDWFYDEVKLAWEYDLIDGVNENEFRPNETLTRAAAIKLAAALNQMYFDGEVTLTNGQYNWYDSYVDYAVNKGIIDAKYSGYSQSQMNAAISRSEFVKIFSGALEESCFEAWNNVADNAIPDVKMTDANADVIYKFYRAGILTGSDAAGTFNPASSITRSEMAAILVRMFDQGSRQSIHLG